MMNYNAKRLKIGVILLLVFLFQQASRVHL